MREIKFRPLRLIKKSGKITVASYLQWRKLLTANYSEFNLILTDEHKSFDKEALVHNHKGEPLFFWQYNPDNVPVFNGWFSSPKEIIKKHEQFGIIWNDDTTINYTMKGADCDGVPTFSHHTIKHIIDSKTKLEGLEPLKVKDVLKWYGWFLYRLDKVNLL